MAACIGKEIQPLFFQVFELAALNCGMIGICDGKGLFETMPAKIEKHTFSGYGWGANRLLFVLAGILLTLGSMSCNPGGGNADASRTPQMANTPQATHTLLPTKIPAPSLTATQSPTPACLEQSGHVEQGEYTSTLLKERVPYLIYLPPCYPEAERSYPTLYLFHGFPFDENHWVELGFVERVDRAISTDSLPSFLIVIPRAPEPLFISTDGGPDSYEVEFIEGFLPRIEKEYQVDPHPEARALAGISRGGIWALEISFRHVDMFDSVIALSPALNVNYARPPYDPIILASEDREFPAGIFLSAGKGEPSFRQATERLVATLEQHNIPHTYVFTQGGHDAEGWVLVFDDVLDFLSKIWTEYN
jgi:enterochelin esterase-like enzyme